MPKINQEEYEVLKELDDKWKWIARDEAQQTYAYEYRPIKSKLRGRWESNWNDYYPLPHVWLQFIQWEDEEPHNIAELIEEYEYSTEHVSHVVNERVRMLGKAWSEGKETEVKSKQELIGKWESAIEAAEFYGKGKEGRLIEYMRNFVDDLNQLGEPEVTLDKAFEKVAESYSMTKEEVWRHLERLEAHGGKVTYDEPEVLSQPLGNSQELEKVQIPQFVADFIEVRKDTDAYTLKYILCVAVERSEQEEYTKAYDWISANDELFARAWLDGYTVEKEQKYVVELPNPNNQMGRHKNVFLNKKDGKVFIDSASLFVNDITKYGQFALTEEEIKKDFEWAWKFAKPVEELEE